jgi:RimJ/RimL family protein N-acetyltransferase
VSETIPYPHAELTTPRMRLRRLRPADAALLALYASDARVARMTVQIPHPYPPGAAEAFVERVRAPGSKELVWALDTGEDGENGLIGLISLKPAPEAEAEIAYWVAPAFWGTGYAGEAIDAVAAWAAARRLVALTAQVFQDNVPSTKVLTRAGFAYEGAGEVHALARQAVVPTFRYRRALGGAGRT